MLSPIVALMVLTGRAGVSAVSVFEPAEQPARPTTRMAAAIPRSDVVNFTSTPL
jgi:hypothetical protein